MSSRVRGKENARARAAEMRAEQARAARRRRVLGATAAVAVVILVVGGLVLAKLTSDGGGSTTATVKSGALPASDLATLTKIPAAASDTVGADGVTAVPSKIKAPALTADGKPKVLYVGAEYCPFCAAERWSMVVSLSRFGTWSGLGTTTSAAKDVYPNTPTLSFHGAKFTSDVVSFTGVETETNKQVNGQYTSLDTLSSADQKTFKLYNGPPYIAQAGGIPFIDLAGTYVSSGASFSPQILAGKTHAQIVKAIADPTSTIGKAVLGNANVLSAAICQATGNKPATVCTSPGVRAGAAALVADQAKK
jgi:hypothetical protein